MAVMDMTPKKTLALPFHSGCRLPRADERLVSQPNECNLLSEISERGYVHETDSVQTTKPIEMVKKKLRS